MATSGPLITFRAVVHATWPTGEGSYAWADGAAYQGGWRENKMHGQGKYVDKEGVAWKGQFHNGKYFNGKSYIILR